MFQNLNERMDKDKAERKRDVEDLKNELRERTLKLTELMDTMEENM